MNIKELIATTEKILEEYNSLAQPCFIKEELVLIYCQKVLRELRTILIENNNTPAALETWLAENWAIIQGTCLSYTALPDLDVTHLICHIALFVAEEKNKNEACPTGVLKFLMPSLSVDGLLSLYPSQYPSLTPTPDNPLDINPAEVLKKYIEGTLGRYLIPVTLIFPEDSLHQIKNPHYDLFSLSEDITYISTHGQKYQGYLSPQEYRRLANHSPETKAFITARLQLEFLLNDQSHFLGNVQRLIQHLHLNSVDVHGEENNASSGGYTAIIDFFDYYQKLSTEDKNKIPAEVNKQLQLILNLGSDPNNHKNGPAIESCLATRKTDLKNAIEPYHELLSSITLTRENKTNLLIEAKIALKESESLLQKTIHNKNYSGHDALNLNDALLKKLNMTISIESFEDLQKIQALAPLEITSLLRDETLQKKILSQFNYIEDWIVFMIQTKIGPLNAFLKIMAAPLCQKLIKNPLHLIPLLTSPNLERCELLCKTLQTQLPRIIPSSFDLSILLKSLKKEQKSILIKTIRNHLPSLIRSAHDLECILQHDLSDSDLRYLYTSINNIGTLTRRARNFRSLMTLTNPETHSDIFQDIKKNLNLVIESADDINLLIKHLSPEETEEAWQSINREVFLKALQTFVELKKILRILNESLQIAFLNLLKDKNIKPSPSSVDDFLQTLDELSPEPRSLFLEHFIEELSTVIKSPDNITTVLKSLSDEEFKNACNLMKKHLLKIANSHYHIKNISQQLTRTKRLFFIDLMETSEEKSAPAKTSYRRS